MKESTYKFAYLNKTQILSASRKALIAADPNYYAWSPVRQQYFRATISEETQRRIECVLLSALFDMTCTVENVDEIWGDIPHSRLGSLNWAKLLTTGVGEDFIYLNECMTEGKSLLDFPTLYDYDYADHLFQEQARQRDFPEYKGTDYYAYRHPSWVRLLIDQNFYYSTFTSLATYLLDEIEVVGNKVISQLIPHQFIEGEKNGKPEQGGFRLDIKIEAGGQEAQLDELKSRWHTYQQERWFELSEICKNLPPPFIHKTRLGMMILIGFLFLLMRPR